MLTKDISGRCIAFVFHRMANYTHPARRTERLGCGRPTWASRTDCGNAPMSCQTISNRLTYLVRLQLSKNISQQFFFFLFCICVSRTEGIRVGFIDHCVETASVEVCCWLPKQPKFWRLRCCFSFAFVSPAAVWSPYAILMSL